MTDASTIRQRFLAALETGKSIKDATRIANGLHVPSRDKVKLPAPPSSLKGDDVAPLRAEYERVVGKKPFPGWNADQLREKMAAANA